MLSFEINLKIFLLGCNDTGRSEFILRFSNEDFPTSYLRTIGVENKIKQINIDDLDININIWTTARQERFRSFPKSFFSSSDGIILLYDITNRESFYHLKNYYLEFQDCSKNDKCIIAGINLDLKDKREVPRKKVELFCQKNHLEEIEVSTKLGTNIDECVEKLVKLIIGNQSKVELIKKYKGKINIKHFKLQKYISF